MRNKTNSTAIITTILFSIVVMISCTSKSKDTTAPNVSFSSDVLPIFRTSCAIGSGCHIGAYSLNDNTDLTDSMAYTTIIRKNLVMTTTPTASILYNEIATGDMPQAPYGKLSATQINLVLNWIKQGAKNN